MLCGIHAAVPQLAKSLALDIILQLVVLSERQIWTAVTKEIFSPFVATGSKGVASLGLVLPDLLQLLTFNSSSTFIMLAWQFILHMCRAEAKRKPLR